MRRIKTAVSVCMIVCLMAVPLGGCGVASLVKEIRGNSEPSLSTDAGDYDEEEKPTSGPASKAESEPVTASEAEPEYGTASKVESEPVTESEVESEFDISSEEDCKKLLAGKWNYAYPQGLFNGEALMSFEFTSDGTFSCVRYDRYNSGNEYHYSGKWSFLRIYRSDNELPDALSFELTQTDDPLDKGTYPFGDYQFDNIAIKDGQYLMGLRRMNNGEAVFDTFFHDDNPILYKENEKIEKVPKVEIPKNGVIQADVYGAELTGETKKGVSSVVYAVDISDSKSKIGVISEFEFPDDYSSEIPAEALTTGFMKVDMVLDDMPERLLMLPKEMMLLTMKQTVCTRIPINPKVSSKDTLCVRMT